MWRADNSVKNWLNLPINNPKLDLNDISVDTKIGENPLILTQVILRKQKYEKYGGQITLSKIDEICPLTIPNHSPLI